MQKKEYQNKSKNTLKIGENKPNLQMFGSGV